MSKKELLLAINESVRILFNLHETVIFLSNAEEDAVSSEEVGTKPEYCQHMSIPLNATLSLAADAIINRQVRTSFDTSYSATPLDLRLAGDLSAEGLLCIPMLARQRTIGVIVCGMSVKQHAHMRSHIPWLSNFGMIAAVSLEAIIEAQHYRLQVERELTKRFERHACQIMHEAGNPLSIIKNYHRALERKLPQDNEPQNLRGLNDEIDHVADIVGQMTESLKAATTEFVTTDLVRALNDFFAIYADTLFKSKNIQIEKQFQINEIQVTAHRNSLKQIVLNLWKNASEALSAGKLVKVTLTDNIIHDGASYVQLRIDDNGPGMPEQNIQSLYRPKAITDSSTRGIGLSIVGTLAKQEGILITCRSQPGVGTSIALLIPKAGRDSNIADR